MPGDKADDMPAPLINNNHGRVSGFVRQKGRDHPDGNTGGRDENVPGIGPEMFRHGR